MFQPILDFLLDKLQQLEQSTDYERAEAAMMKLRDETARKIIMVQISKPGSAAEPPEEKLAA
ncbi:MAG TPA: hypothetical protein VGR47_21675 [Terracidiphilus sp.]|nr:hypothetical protein [Terracidiphilus sp.]